jgi:hypothetical protein
MAIVIGVAQPLIKLASPSIYGFRPNKSDLAGRSVKVVIVFAMFILFEI